MPKMAKVSTVTVGSTTLGVAVGRRQFIADWLLAKAEVIRAMRERVQLSQDLQTEFAFLRESPAFCRNGSWKHAWPQSLKKPPPSTSKPLMTTKLYVQKAAQAADEAWRQIIGGLQGPSVTNPTMSGLEHHTTQVFTLCCVDSNSQTKASPPNPDGSQKHNPGQLIFSLPLQSQEQCGPGRVCRIFQSSSGSWRRSASSLCATRAFTCDPLSGQPMGDHTLP